MITTTNRDYDLGEVSKAVRGVLIGLAIVSSTFLLTPIWDDADILRNIQMVFMHFYLKYTQPLFIQSILPIKSLYESQVNPASLPSISTPFWYPFLS